MLKSLTTVSAFSVSHAIQNSRLYAAQDMGHGQQALVPTYDLVQYMQVVFFVVVAGCLLLSTCDDVFFFFFSCGAA